MDIFITFFVGFVIGSIISLGLYAVFVVHRIEKIEKQSKKILDEKNIGNLRIDRSDPDSVYLFAELNPRSDLHDGEQIVMTVVDKNYISDSQ